MNSVPAGGSGEDLGVRKMLDDMGRSDNVEGGGRSIFDRKNVDAECASDGGAVPRHLEGLHVVAEGLVLVSAVTPRTPEVEELGAAGDENVADGAIAVEVAIGVGEVGLAVPREILGRENRGGESLPVAFIVERDIGLRGSTGSRYCSRQAAHLNSRLTRYLRSTLEWASDPQ